MDGQAGSFDLEGLDGKGIRYQTTRIDPTKCLGFPSLESIDKSTRNFAGLTLNRPRHFSLSLWKATPNKPPCRPVRKRFITDTLRTL